MKKNHIILYCISIVIQCIIIICSAFNFINISFAMILIGAIYNLIMLKYTIGNYSNIIILFYVFHILYGISGPFAEMYGEGLPEIFGEEYDFGAFFIAYAIATIALTIGIMITNIKKKENQKFKCIEEVYINKKYYLSWSFALALISSIFEIINFFRVGGVSTLLKGKAYYQEAISNLSLALPSNIIITVAIAIFSLYIFSIYKKEKKLKIKYIFGFIVELLQYLTITILLGQRGRLLEYLIIIFLAYTYINPMNKIKAKLVVIAICAYILLCFLFANRAIVQLLFTDPDYFFREAFSAERLLPALNPGTNEFGAAFGNFNKFYISESKDYLYGSSYIKGLVIFIPSFLYIGEKPQQITYEFRDKFFPSEAERSSIAGTGFSSILEAYWNFGWVGIFLEYLLIGIILTYLENNVKGKNTLYTLIYFFIGTATIAFHRNALGDVISGRIWQCLIAIFIYICQNKSKCKGENNDKIYKKD